MCPWVCVAPGATWELGRSNDSPGPDLWSSCIGHGTHVFPRHPNLDITCSLGLQVCNPEGLTIHRRAPAPSWSGPKRPPQHKGVGLTSTGSPYSALPSSSVLDLSLCSCCVPCPCPQAEASRASVAPSRFCLCLPSGRPAWPPGALVSLGVSSMVLSVASAQTCSSSRADVF